MTMEYGALTYRSQTAATRTTSGWIADLRRFVAGAIFAAALTALGTVLVGVTLLAVILTAPVLAAVIGFAVVRRRSLHARALA